MYVIPPLQIHIFRTPEPFMYVHEYFYNASQHTNFFKLTLKFCKLLQVFVNNNIRVVFHTAGE